MQWAAPELIRGADHTFAADVYAFGCVAYELFVLKTPFQEQRPVTLHTLVGSEGLRLKVPDPDQPHDYTAAIDGVMKDCFRDSGRPTFAQLTQRLGAIESSD